MSSRDGGETWEDCASDLVRFCEEPRYRSRIVSQTEIEGMLDGSLTAEDFPTAPADALAHSS